MAFFKYSLIRGILFLAFFLIAYLALPSVGVHFSPLTAALIGALCAFLVSFLFFRKQREGATAAVAKTFAPNANTSQSAGAVADAEAEDALIDENPDIWIDADRKSGTTKLDKPED